MPFHLRILNLKCDVTNKDIRKLFSGMTIQDGGVTVIGGPKGEAFVTFATETDLLWAMQKDGQHNLELQIADEMDKLEAINKMCVARLQSIGGGDVVNTPKKYPEPGPPQYNVEARKVEVSGKSGNDEHNRIPTVMQQETPQPYNIQSSGRHRYSERGNFQGNVNAHLKRSQDSLVDKNRVLKPSSPDTKRIKRAIDGQREYTLMDRSSTDARDRSWENEKTTKHRHRQHDASDSYSKSDSSSDEKKGGYKDCSRSSPSEHSIPKTILRDLETNVTSTLESPRLKPMEPSPSDVKILSGQHQVTQEQTIPTYSEILHALCKKAPVQAIPSATYSHSTQSFSLPMQQGPQSSYADPSKLVPITPDAGLTSDYSHTLQPTYTASAQPRHFQPTWPRYSGPMQPRPGQLYRQQAPYLRPSHPRPTHFHNMNLLNPKSPQLSVNSSNSNTSQPQYFSGLAKFSDLQKGKDHLPKTSTKQSVSTVQESLFKTLLPEGRAPRYNILVSDLPPNVTSSVVYKWVGAEKGTAIGVILIKPTNDHPVAFVVYDNEADRDNSLRQSGTGTKAFSDTSTLEFITKFIMNWFKWKGNKNVSTPIYETTRNGIDRSFSFKDMITCAKLSLQKPIGPVSKTTETPSICQAHVDAVEKKVEYPIPTGKTIPKTAIGMYQGSLFRTLSTEGRAPYYAICVSDLPPKITPNMVYSWVDGDVGTPLGVILLKPINKCPVAFIIYDNEAARDLDNFILQIHRTADPFSDAGTLNFITKFIREWFESNGDVVKSPITETFSGPVSFLAMQQYAMLSVKSPVMVAHNSESVFKTLASVDRPPQYTICLSYVHPKNTAAKVLSWAHGKNGTAHAAILLKPSSNCPVGVTYNCPVAFLFYHNEAERDQGIALLRHRRRVEAFSDADTLNYLTKFITEWFGWKGGLNVNSPITESNIDGGNSFVSFADMLTCAKLRSPNPGKVTKPTEASSISPPEGDDIAKGSGGSELIVSPKSKEAGVDNEKSTDEISQHPVVPAMQRCVKSPAMVAQNGESIFKTLASDDRPPQYAIRLSDIPAKSTATKVFYWVYGKNGTAHAAILLNPSSNCPLAVANNCPVAFLFYHNEADRDQGIALLRHSRTVEAFSDSDTLNYLTKFITDWFEWKGSLNVNSPISEASISRFDSYVSFSDLLTCAKLPIPIKPGKVTKMTAASYIPPSKCDDITKGSNIPSGGSGLDSPKSKEAGVDNEKSTELAQSSAVNFLAIQRCAKLSMKSPVMLTQNPESVFKTLASDDRPPQYAIRLSDIPAKSTAAKVFSWVHGNKGASHAAIMLKPTSNCPISIAKNCPVAFLFYHNEAERDQCISLLSHNLTVEAFSDSDTLNYLTTFIRDWFEWKGTLNVNSPITESNGSGGDSYVSFIDMLTYAKLPIPIKPGKVTTYIHPPGGSDQIVSPKSKEAGVDNENSTEEISQPPAKIRRWKKPFNLVDASRMFYFQLKTFDQTYSANEIWSWFPTSEGVFMPVDSTGHAIGAVIAFEDSVHRYNASQEAAILNTKSPRWSLQKPLTPKQAKVYLATKATTNYQIRVSTLDQDRVITREEGKILAELKPKSNVVPMVYQASGGESFINCLKTPDNFWECGEMILALYSLDRNATACDILELYPGGVCAAKINFYDLGPHDSEAMAYVFFKDRDSREMAKVMINCGKNIGSFETIDRKTLELLLARSCHTCTISESSKVGVDRIVAMNELELVVTGAPFKLTDSPHYLQLDKFTSKYSASQLWSQRGERDGFTKGVILVVPPENGTSKAFLAVDSLSECLVQARKIMVSKHLQDWKVHIVSESDVLGYLNELSIDYTIKVSTETGQDRPLDDEELSYIAKDAAVQRIDNDMCYVLILNWLTEIKTAFEMLEMYTDEGAKSATLIRDSNGVNLYAFVMFNGVKPRGSVLSKPWTVECTKGGFAVHLASFDSNYVILESTDDGEDRVITAEGRAHLDPKDKK